MLAAAAGGAVLGVLLGVTLAPQETARPPIGGDDLGARSLSDQVAGVARSVASLRDSVAALRRAVEQPANTETIVPPSGDALDADERLLVAVGQLEDQVAAIALHLANPQAPPSGLLGNVNQQLSLYDDVRSLGYLPREKWRFWTPGLLLSTYGEPYSVTPRDSGGLLWTYRSEDGVEVIFVVREGVALELETRTGPP